MRTSPKLATDLVVVCGDAGVGKSIFASMLAGKLGAALIDKDVVSRAFAEAFVGTLDSTSEDYATRLRPAQYAALDAIAEDNLCAGVSAVIVAPYGGERATKK